MRYFDLIFNLSIFFVFLLCFFFRGEIHIWPSMLIGLFWLVLGCQLYGLKKYFHETKIFFVYLVIFMIFLWIAAEDILVGMYWRYAGFL